MATIIDGKSIAESILQEIKEKSFRLKEEKGIQPGLAFLLVGENPASHVYVRMKGKACDQCGFHSVTIQLPETTSEVDVLSQIDRWNIDPDIHGILVQMPLPKHIDEAKVIEAIRPSKDVDGFHPKNVGNLVIGKKGFRPCTPAGIQELLKRANVKTEGKHVVVVGRSNIVGKPIANMLVQKAPHANAIVTMCHTAAKNISVHTKRADILIAAMGAPEAITGDMVKKNCVVIDVGVNRVDDAANPKGYKLVGDVHFESVREKASLITPVPGGVGPMTIAMLMQNTYLAASGGWK